MSTKDGEGTRPAFPKRAIVTAGMPYGNKGLHFGHIAGVFVPADCYARFLRDRIGPENVMFVSGTDCYGSPIDEGYRKLREQGFEGSIAYNEFVKLAVLFPGAEPSEQGAPSDASEAAPDSGRSGSEDCSSERSERVPQLLRP